MFTRQRMVTVWGLALMIFLLCATSAAGETPVSDYDPKLIGVWDLVSMEQRFADGMITQPWGEHPAGRITFDRESWVSAILMHENRNHLGAKFSLHPEVEHLFVGYFGTYKIITSHTIEITTEGTLRMNEAGTFLRRYEIQDDRLMIFAPASPVSAYTLTYRRLTTEVGGP